MRLIASRHPGRGHRRHDHRYRIRLFFKADCEAAGEVCACGRINPGKIRLGQGCKIS